MNNYLRSIVRVSVKPKNASEKTAGYGTGVIVWAQKSLSVILTAGHVIKGLEPPEALIFPPQEYNARYRFFAQSSSGETFPVLCGAMSERYFDLALLCAKNNALTEALLPFPLMGEGKTAQADYWALGYLEPGIEAVKLPSCKPYISYHGQCTLRGDPPSGFSGGPILREGIPALFAITTSATDHPTPGEEKVLVGTSVKGVRAFLTATLPWLFTPHRT
jgi:hypothetical protein